jgi:hypothetical protein
MFFCGDRRAQATGSGADDERVAGRGVLPDHSIIVLKSLPAGLQVDMGDSGSSNYPPQ